jgi:hypothetical protein
VREREVWLELDNGPAIEGRLLDFGAASVTVELATTHEVVTIARDHVVRLVVTEAPPAPPPRLRTIGVQFGLPGTLVVDERMVWECAELDRPRVLRDLARGQDRSHRRDAC